MIILASRSPRRKKLLEQLNITFRVEPSSCKEHFDENEQPSQIVQDLALQKAADVADGKKNALIIGADTIVVYNDRILGKPGSANEAKRMLKSLCGTSHTVLTGVGLVKTDKEGNISDQETFFERTQVYFGKLTDSEINNYVASGSPMDKAGSYGIQDDWGALFVEKIEGDYNNVVGLPLYSLYHHLKKFAPEVLHTYRYTMNHD